MAPESVELVALIDDSDIDLFVHRRFIELSGFAKRVVTYKSPREALTSLASCALADSPDIIFLDLNMPEIDGFTFLDRYLRLALKKVARVVILTSSSSTYDRERAASYQNVAFLSKPLTEAALEKVRG